MSLPLLFVYEINKFRANPKSYGDRLDKICKEMADIKRKKKIYDELLTFKEKLKKQGSLPPVKLNSTLNKVADLRVETLLESPDVNDLMEIAKASASGFKKIFQINQEFNENPISFIVEALIDPKDDDKNCRKALLEHNVKYVGFNDMEEGIKNGRLTMILSDEISGGAKDNKSKEQQILDMINIYRRNTKLAGEYIDEVRIEAKKQKAPSSYIDSVNKLVAHCYSVGKLQPVALNPILTHLADSFSKNPPDVMNKAKLDEFVKTKINSFSHIYGCYSTEEDDPENIVKYSLTSEDDNIAFESKMAFLSKNSSEIGVAYNAKKHTVVFVAVDGFLEGEALSFDEAITDEINHMRSQPKDFINMISKLKDIKKWNTAQKTTAFKNIISDVSKRKLQKEVTIHDNLNAACMELIQHSEGKKGLFREEEEVMKIRLQHYVHGAKHVFQIIERGTQDPKEVFLNMLIHEREGMDNLEMMFFEKARFIGVAHAQIQANKWATVIMIVDELRNPVPGQFIDDLRDEVNHIRVYPKSYIKVFQEIHDKPEIDDNNKDKEMIKKEALNMLNFCKRSKNYIAMVKNEFLMNAAEARLESILNRENQEPLNVFLQEHCREYNESMEFVNKGFKTARSFLCSNLMNIEDSDKVCKNTIFHQKYDNYGFAYDEGSKVAVAIFTDIATSPILEKDPPVSRLWDKLSRPKLSNDEIKQLKKDFEAMDTHKFGYLFPEAVVSIMDLIGDDFKEKNPIYYEAFQILNTMSNNAYGIYFQQFVKGVEKVMQLQEKNRWEEIYDSLVANSENGVLDYHVLYDIMKNLNYDYTEDEIKDIVYKISQDGFEIEKKNQGKEIEEEDTKGKKGKGKDTGKGKSSNDEFTFLSKEKFMQIIVSIESNWQLKK